MSYFFNKKVLIIGGTGSLGRALLDRFLLSEYPPKEIVVFSRDEAKQHNLRVEYTKRGITDKSILNNFNKIVKFRIGDIRNKESLYSVIKDVNIVINVAALKQVPVCEYFPKEAIHTNIIGTLNIIDVLTSIENNVECVIGISTDKACKPINAYGMTKGLMEKLFISENIRSSNKRFILVRYGNVLYSTGSVLPLFKEQIEIGGPLTLTHPEATRFFFTLNDAVNTILYAAEYAYPGEIYVPILPSFKIKDIARYLIGNKKIEIKVIGLRPGEKLHEELISEEEGSRTYIKGNYYIIEPPFSELKVETNFEKVYLNKSYSSKDNVLPYNQIKNKI